jgi:hypothetical protein
LFATPARIVRADCSGVCAPGGGSTPPAFQIAVAVVPGVADITWMFSSHSS